MSCRKLINRMFFVFIFIVFTVATEAALGSTVITPDYPDFVKQFWASDPQSQIQLAQNEPDNYMQYLNENPVRVKENLVSCNIRPLHRK